MQVALLSAGPSLLRTFEDSFEFDVRIGVNRAAEKFRCDWWAVGDWQAIVGHGMAALQPLGDPQVFTLDTSIESMDLRSLRVAKPLAGFKSTCGYLNPPIRWATWSATAGVVLARHIGATSLDVFGVDMSNTPDVCNKPGRHGPDRWQRERPVWEACIQWIRSQGVRVVIHQPNGIPEVAA